MPPIPGIDDVSYWTSREATSTRELPSSLVILGGGVVGVEMAQVFVRFGVRVTLVEGGDRILSRDHPLTSKHVADQLEEEGLDPRTGVTAQRVRAGGAGPHRRALGRLDRRGRRAARGGGAATRGPPRAGRRGGRRDARRPRRARRPTTSCASPTACSWPEMWRAASSSRTSPTTKAGSPRARRRAFGRPRRPQRRAEGDVHRPRGGRPSGSPSRRRRQRASTRSRSRGTSRARARARPSRARAAT